MKFLILTIVLLGYPVNAATVASSGQKVVKGPGEIDGEYVLSDWHCGSVDLKQGWLKVSPGVESHFVVQKSRGSVESIYPNGCVVSLPFTISYPRPNVISMKNLVFSCGAKCKDGVECPVDQAKTGRYMSVDEYEVERGTVLKMNYLKLNRVLSESILKVEPEYAMGGCKAGDRETLNYIHLAPKSKPSEKPSS